MIAQNPRRTGRPGRWTIEHDFSNLLDEGTLAGAAVGREAW